MLNEAFCLSNNSPLDSFQLFYEELRSSKKFVNRIRRLRRATVYELTISSTTDKRRVLYTKTRLFSTRILN